MRVIDFIPPDLQRLCRVKSFMRRNHAAIQSHSGGKHFENRAELINPQSHAIEMAFLPVAHGRIGIKIGQRDEGNNFAIMGIDNQRPTGTGRECFYGFTQHIAYRMLDANIEAGLQCRADFFFFQQAVEIKLQP